MRSDVRSAALTFALCAGIAACDSPADPCDDCTIVRPDLRVASVTVQAAGRAAVSGLAIVPRDSIDVMVDVHNAGATSARHALLALEIDGDPAAVIELPELRAGRTHRVQKRIATGVGDFMMNSDTMRVLATVAWSDDDRDNNVLSSDAFHVPVPALRLTVDLMQIAFNVNVMYPVQLAVENVSRIAGFPASRVAFCVHSMGAFCTREDGASGFNAINVPALRPGERIAWTDAFTVPSGVTHQNLIEAVAVTPCIADADLQASDFVTASQRGCIKPSQVFVRPDYESCAPARLQANAPTAVVPTCVRPCPIYAYAVDVHPGQSYVIEELGGGEAVTLRWRTRYRDEPVDVSPERGLQPARSETVYAVTAPKFCGGITEHAVVLRQEPFGPGR